MTDINDLYEPGDDREPEPPDEHEEPLDLEEIRASIPAEYEAPWTVQPGVDHEGHLVWHVLYDTTNPDAGLVATLPDYAEGLAEFIAHARTVVPHLLSRLRAAETALATLRAMPIEERRYVVVTDACSDPEKPLAVHPSPEDAIEHAAFCDGRALRRAVYLGPWEDLRDFAAEAPF